MAETPPPFINLLSKALSLFIPILISVVVVVVVVWHHEQKPSSPSLSLLVTKPVCSKGCMTTTQKAHLKAGSSRGFSRLLSFI